MSPRSVPPPGHTATPIRRNTAPRSVATGRTLRVQFPGRVSRHRKRYGNPGQRRHQRSSGHAEVVPNRTPVVRRAVTRQAQPNFNVRFLTGYAQNAVLRSAVLDQGTAMITKPFRARPSSPMCAKQHARPLLSGRPHGQQPHSAARQLQSRGPTLVYRISWPISILRFRLLCTVAVKQWS